MPSLPSLDIADVTPADEGAYSVRVTSIAGSVISAEAPLTLRRTAPVLTAALPTRVDVTAGRAATFTVSFAGHGLPVQIQWFKDGAAFPGATAAVLQPARSTGKSLRSTACSPPRSWRS